LIATGSVSVLVVKLPGERSRNGPGGGPTEVEAPMTNA
jgi:hypothetical protein